MALHKVSLPEDGATAHRAELTQIEPAAIVRVMGRRFSVAIVGGPVTVQANLGPGETWFVLPSLHKKTTGLYHFHDPVFEVRASGEGTVTIFVAGRA